MKILPIILVVAYGCAACGAPQRSEVQISKSFNVCANLPSDASYRFDRRGIDFDLGNLSYKNGVARVYIGHQPDFPGKTWARELPADFSLLASHVEGSEKKWVIGRAAKARSGPLFVMLTSQDADTFHPLVTEERFITACNRG